MWIHHIDGIKLAPKIEFPMSYYIFIHYLECLWSAYTQNNHKSWSWQCICFLLAYRPVKYFSHCTHIVFLHCSSNMLWHSGHMEIFSISWNTLSVHLSTCLLFVFMHSIDILNEVQWVCKESFAEHNGNFWLNEKVHCE